MNWAEFELSGRDLFGQGERVLTPPAQGGSDLSASLLRFRERAEETLRSHNIGAASSARLWARALVDPTDTFQVGDRVQPVAAAFQGGVAIRWVSRGREAGVHVILPRKLTGTEIRLIAATTGRICDFAHFDPDPNQSGDRFQVIVIEAPAPFAAAFADGRLPRPDIMPSDLGYGSEPGGR